jgi:drug/metabolite transporter (DMT)-like permease
VSHPAAPRSRVASALLAVYVIWGSTYLGIRLVVTGGLPALPAMGVRFLASGAVLMTILRLRGGPGALRLTRDQLRSVAVVGVLMLVVGNGFVAVAEQTVPSGLAALLVSMTPIWLVVLAALIGTRTRGLTWAGTVIGFAGTAVLARPGAHGGGVAWWGVALVLCASFGWAVGSLASGRLPMPKDPIVAASYQMLVGGTLMLVVGCTTGMLGYGLGGVPLRDVDLAAVPASAWLGLVYLFTFGSLVAYTCFYWLLRNAPIQLVSTYAYVNPVVAVLLGWALLDEQVTGAELIGGAIAVLGVAVVITSERRPRAATIQDRVGSGAGGNRRSEGGDDSQV